MTWIYKTNPGVFSMTNADEIKNESSLLKGNIKQMCTTTDTKELEVLRDLAKKRIDNIFECRQDQIWKGDL